MLKKGEIIEGTISRIMEYGAFVNLPDGKRGLIHISEIANSYVSNVNDYLKENQKVKVKVLNISVDERKIDLSLKQADNNGEEKERVYQSKSSVSEIESLHASIRGSRRRGSDPATLSFEEKLSKFLKSSEEKLADLRRNIESKRGGKFRN